MGYFMVKLGYIGLRIILIFILIKQNGADIYRKIEMEMIFIFLPFKYQTKQFKINSMRLF